MPDIVLIPVKDADSALALRVCSCVKMENGKFERLLLQGGGIF